MKALNILTNLTKEDITFKKICEINEAIEELDTYIANYQVIRNKLDAKAEVLAELQNENETLKQIIKNLGENND